jgi:hypothetical protein
MDAVSACFATMISGVMIGLDERHPSWQAWEMVVP